MPSKTAHATFAAATLLQFYSTMIFLIKICASAFVIGLGFRFSNWFQLIEHSKNFCQSQIPDSPYHELYGAIVCGMAIHNPTYKQIFINSGLIHILVVSGSHLLFLEQIPFLKKIDLKWKLGFILFPFTCLTGFQAPVARAFIIRTLSLTKFKNQVHLSAIQTQALGTVICFLVMPEWIHSLSFSLSWICGLILASPKISATSSEFENSIKIFLGLIPFASYMGLVSPISIITNWLIAPIIGTILFPLSILSTWIHQLTPYIDMVWTLLLKLLIPFSAVSPEFVQFGASHLQFTYPLFLHGLLLCLEVKCKRNTLF